MAKNHESEAPYLPTISKYSLWDVADFLVDIRAKVQFTQDLETKDQTIALQQIDFLFLESQKANRQRDRAKIIATWRSLRPLLERYQLFSDYQGEATLRFRVQLFIFGKSR